jgi:hypothetical protein
MHANEHPTGSKGHHEFVPAAAAKDPLAKTGYVEREYEHQEYPKVLCQDAHGKDVIAKSAAEEKAYNDKKAAAAKKADEDASE